MIAITMKEIEKYYASHKVLNSITLEINEGERVALIGSNGCGKTTLFKLIAGIEKQDKGMLAIKKNAKIGYLEQVPKELPGQTVLDVLQQGVKEIIDLRTHMEKLENQMAQQKDTAALNELMERYGRERERFEQLDGYQAESRIDLVAQGISISKDMFQQDYNQLSGGEKTKVLFARTLISQPDILLLDEPTNHLDIKAIEWLEGYISEYKGTVFIISHDRYFLDRAIMRVIEIEDGECEAYNGNYSYYIEEKERRQLIDFDNYQDQQKKIKKMEEAIKRYRDWGNRGDNEKFFKKAASMQKALDKLEKLERPVLEPKRIGLSFDAGERSGKDVLVCEQLVKGYEGRSLFDKADMYLQYKERVGILGDNGTGKSTLIRMILGQEEPDGGKIELGSNVRIGCLEQSVKLEGENKTILEAFKGKCCMDEQKARSVLAKFLFYKDSVFKKIKDLSGGEKTRLRLAELMQEDINLLVLDEPTNHLDIETREVLEEALLGYEGSILFISHDRFFVNKLANRIYHIEDKKLVHYNGNYDYFKEKYAETKNIGAEIQKSKDKGSKPVRVIDTEAQKQKLLSQLEEAILEVEKQIDEAKNAMLDPDNSSDYVLLQSLQLKVEVLQVQLDELYTKWHSMI